ncbi:hypothetical protein FH972_012758 [Carpinus fangiana]|uniref:Uncharacterized protein n=1 Tax=Carpinus fangiana TaxID=176857 RepID=A0A5N6R4P4_9ROSI|nr:hypothetical protein FH972_012758 [Carpinus fangiana]
MESHKGPFLRPNVRKIRSLQAPFRSTHGIRASKPLPPTRNYGFMTNRVRPMPYARHHNQPWTQQVPDG